MSGEHSNIRALKRQWDTEDAERDKLERRRKEIFLEAEAHQTFSPIEDYLTRLGGVLGAAGGSVEIGTTWEHLSDQRLRRTVKVTSTESEEEFVFDLTIKGVSISYHGRTYQFSSGSEALIRAITSEVEQFLTPGRKGNLGL